MTVPDNVSLIEGGFTYDSLPDLFRYLCGRGESLFWELKTLAGTFEMTILSGFPVDLILRPERMVGAKVGVKAARIMFRQQGGRFRVRRNVPALVRPASLTGTCEHLLIELATLDDETDAPGARASRLRSVVSDRSSDLQLVVDIPPIDHQTAFQANSADVPLTDVLQLFSVSSSAYQISLLRGEKVIGSVRLRSGAVLAAECWPLVGERAFSSLIGHVEALTVDVRAQPLVEEPGLTPLGTLDALLLREVLSGRLGAGSMTSWLQETPEVPDEGKREVPAQTSQAPSRPSGKEKVGQDRRPFWRRLLGQQ